MGVAIRTQVDHDASIIRFELEGTFETDEMLEALDRAFAERQAGRVYDVISDNRALTRAATPDQIQALVARLEREGKAAKGMRCAVVVTRDVSYGMMRVLAAHAEPLGIEVKVFRSLDEAIAFI